MRAHLSKIWQRLRKFPMAARPSPKPNRRRPLALEALEARLTPSVVGVTNTAPALISGHAYIDGNKDGVFDAGDTALPGVTVTLTGTNVSSRVTTDANGVFTFREVTPGTYTLTRAALSGFNGAKATFGTLGGTVAANVISAISVGEGQVGLNYNFGMFPPVIGSGVSLRDFTGSGSITLPPAGGGQVITNGTVQPASITSGTGSLAGTIYGDTNNNGLKDGTETGIAGILVTLTGIDDKGASRYFATTTSSTGTYKFSNLRPGTYTISTPALPAAFVAGMNTAGSLGGFLIRNSQIADIIITTGQAGTGYNFGELPRQVVSGTGIVAQLADDTFGAGVVNGTTDNITSDPTIIGQVIGTGTLTSLKAGFTTANTDILANRGPGGRFILDLARLTQINGGPLPDGNYTLHLSATDSAGHTFTTSVVFTLKAAPIAVTGLAITGSTGPFTSATGLRTTTTSTSTSISGVTAPNAQVVLTLGATTTTTTADGSGVFTIATGTLNGGVTNFTLTSTDIAGNFNFISSFVVDDLTTTADDLLRKFNGTFTSGSTTITFVGSPVGLFAGQEVTGAGLAAGTTILSVGATSITISAPTTAASTGGTGGETLTVQLPDQFTRNGTVASASESGNTVTITTTTPNHYRVGQTVTISGVGVTSFNGIFITGSKTVTIVGAPPAALAVGEIISGAGIVSGTKITAISGNTITLSAAATANSTGGAAGQILTTSTPYNGTFTIASTPSSTTFTYKVGSTGLATISGSGTVTGGAITFDLNQFFTSANVTNSVVRFNTSSGGIDVTLNDSATPATVANFLTYVNSGAYNSDIFSRLVKGFVLQGGGATFSQSGTTGSLTPVATNPGVVNEFGASRSNVYGTLALAQSAGNINSGTSQFFFNIANNAATLDPQKFTVFGGLQNGFAQRTVNTLKTYPTKNESSHPVSGVDLQNVPLKNYTGTHFPADTTASNYALISSVSVIRRTEALSYGSTIGNTNAAVASVSISNGNRLSITPLSSGSTTISISVTDMANVTVSFSFTLTVT